MFGRLLHCHYTFLHPGKNRSIHILSSFFILTKELPLARPESCWLHVCHDLALRIYIYIHMYIYIYTYVYIYIYIHLDRPPKNHDKDMTWDSCLLHSDEPPVICRKYIHQIQVVPGLQSRQAITVRRCWCKVNRHQ